ncbi:MAG TPA: hypothetical protein PK253_03195 [Spirochaetota bacterium]|nr:hypothetical protein [Spirochaetota bacterium]
MKKKAVEVTIHELEDILNHYIDAGSGTNYALKIIGHPGVGKSAVVKEVANKRNYYFIDTRLAFKENIDLGGYPVPDHDAKRMIYYRPMFIPPETIPEGHDGILWFLDESNRAHPTVIQTLFQIITEGTCGEHRLPGNTAIVLAGNMGESDSTTITEFDDSALDGRLAIFHLKPDPGDWLRWAHKEGIHPSITHYISLFPERLWDEINVNPNPRGWHQVSQALTLSYGISSHEELFSYLSDNPEGTLTKLIISLVGEIAGTDFIMQITSPREITTREILSGEQHKLKLMKESKIPTEDILWALSGAITSLREKNIILRGSLAADDLVELGNVLQFIGYARADSRMSFFYLLLKECGLFTQIPHALATIPDSNSRLELKDRFTGLLED